MNRTLRWSLLLLAMAAVPGCNDGGRPEPQRYPVAGTVTLDGQPLAKGTIYFKTLDTGAFDLVEIQDGKFAGQAEAGQRRVEINSYRPGPTSEMGGMKVESEENIIPARYNLQSELTAQVTEAGPNQFTFEVSSQ